MVGSRSAICRPARSSACGSATATSCRHRQPLGQPEPGLVARRAVALLRLQPPRAERHLRPEPCPAGPLGPALRLTTGLDAQTISLSADGRRLAYARHRHREQRLVHAHSGTPARLGPELDRLPTDRNRRGGRGVPGRPLALLRFRSERQHGPLPMALPGGVPERLTTDSSDDFFPDPSPDGREVAFHSWRGGSRDIWVMPLDGGPIQRVTSSPAQEAIASLVTGREPDRLQHLHRARGHLDGAPHQRRLATAGGAARLREFPHVVSRWPEYLLLHGIGGGSLWVMPADSGAPRLIAETVGPSIARRVGSSWTADGHSIITRSHDAQGRPTFWLIPVGGGPPSCSSHSTAVDPHRHAVAGASIRIGWCTRPRSSAVTCG